ncbi:hypothetical protein B0J13DRAFT_584382 [Dactylonectria estremocensis]|uniref:Transcription factor domain-containing protein n=1 Tax=Dactylonectria estremocensis TaxID=1079267 RepID=A0A9P9J9A2_9HYPO|nr:hypothetical protein B0J13DRAFT_584382 [Dactylonectria estremocensis]
MLIVSIRCLALKRECISRTRPRPRRWERIWGTGDTGPSPQSPGHLGTFSIHYTVPVKADLNDNFETLREMHDQALDAVLIEEDPVDSSQSASQSVSLPSPSSLANQSHPISDIWRQPLFDMASAESLLNTFKSMVNYLPFIVFPDDSPISYLATTRPFTLLSILTVASGSRMVQKHALYDDEFRKALGLKYISGGEKSLELLQGLLIYCAWYPFHLRPKNGQLVHYLRIAADLVRDLHLDEDFLTMPDSLGREVTDDELDKIRAYLAYLYLFSTYIVIWRGERDLPTSYPPWATTAVDILQHNPQVDGDNTLVALFRLSSLFSDASKAINERDVQTVQNSRLIFIGLEQQYQELQHSMNHPIMGFGATRMQAMFLDVFFDCGSLLAFPVAKTYLSAKITCFPPPLSKICSATKKIRAFLDYVGELEDSSLLSFTVNDWTRLIVVLTLSFRLSFPLSLCPDFDSAWARSQLQLDQFLSKMSHGGDATASNDLLSASRAVLGLAKSKYDRRLGSLGGPPSVAPASRVFGCPVMDGSLRTSVEQWDPNFTNLSGWTDAGEPKNLPLFHDVWATMTMGWGNASDIP